jgi:hypothetical protein
LLRIDSPRRAADSPLLRIDSPLSTIDSRLRAIDRRLRTIDSRAPPVDSRRLTLDSPALAADFPALKASPRAAKADSRAAQAGSRLPRAGWRRPASPRGSPLAVSAPVNPAGRRPAFHKEDLIMPLSSRADRLTYWKGLVDSMTPRLEEFAHLKEEHGVLREQSELAAALTVEADRLNGLLREVNQKLKEAEKRCQDYAARCVNGLQSHLGKRSPELRQFGIGPLTAGRRKKEEEPPAPTTPPAPAR